MGGIGVVFNPKSRRNARDPRASGRLARALGESGVVREASSIEALYRIATEFRARAVDVLAISGGDGTNTVTLTGFLDVYGDSPLPPIALLRGGTMNTVASSIGVKPGRPEKLLEKLVRTYASAKGEPLASVERHVLRVTPSHSGKTTYGFLFGAGVVHGFLAEYYASGAPTPWVALRTLLRGAGSAFTGGEMIRRMAKPFRGSVVLDDGSRWEERDYLAVAAGTISDIGLGFQPFHRWAERRGAFHALAIYATPAQFVAELPRIYAGRPMRPGRTHEAVTTGLQLESARGALAYMIDGDLHEAAATETPGQVAVTIGPRVKLVV